MINTVSFHFPIKNAEIRGTASAHGSLLHFCTNSHVSFEEKECEYTDFIPHFQEYTDANIQRVCGRTKLNISLFLMRYIL